MCSYLSWATQQPAHTSLSLSGFAKVIRVNIESPPAKPVILQEQLPPAAVIPVAVITEEKNTPVLDLSIPGLEAIGMSQTLSTKNETTSWFETNQDDKVRYDAQLLFDTKEGNTIRGGQLNITIPLG